MIPETSIDKLLLMVGEKMRLGKLSNEDLVKECLKTGASDYIVVMVMMDRLCPGWEKEP